MPLHRSYSVLGINAIFLLEATNCVDAGAVNFAPSKDQLCLALAVNMHHLAHLDIHRCKEYKGSPVRGQTTAGIDHVADCQAASTSAQGEVYTEL